MTFFLFGENLLGPTHWTLTRIKESQQLSLVGLTSLKKIDIFSILAIYSYLYWVLFSLALSVSCLSPSIQLSLSLSNGYVFLKMFGLCVEF